MKEPILHLKGELGRLKEFKSLVESNEDTHRLDRERHVSVINKQIEQFQRALTLIEAADR